MAILAAVTGHLDDSAHEDPPAEYLIANRPRLFV
jgi:hypothetical protein